MVDKEDEGEPPKNVLWQRKYQNDYKVTMRLIQQAALIVNVVPAIISGGNVDEPGTLGLIH